MRQILFHIPIINLPVYGYGLMLFFAFIGCSWLARRLCKREGIDGTMIPDVAIWLFVAGIIGGRLWFVVWYWRVSPPHVGFADRPFLDVIKLWDGGLILYGALFGGAAGYFAYHYLYLRPKGVSIWKMFDVIAPCIVLGIAFGRIGCLFTGCCYGNVACETCPVVPIHFPLYTNTGPPPQFTAAAGDMIKHGYQTVNGFLLDGPLVSAVEPGTPAAEAGLKVGDIIVKVNGKDFARAGDIDPSEGGLYLTVLRGADTVQLPVFNPTSIGLTPTQPFETISMIFLLFFMLSYYPYKRRDGELLVILLLVYAVHRFLNEMLRTDVDAGWFGMTLSQNISIAIFATGVVLAIVVWRRKSEPEALTKSSEPATLAKVDTHAADSGS
jgi:phosphatidylglycerol:prolipoprotein diacylglycerol transferase